MVDRKRDGKVELDDVKRYVEGGEMESFAQEGARAAIGMVAAGIPQIETVLRSRGENDLADASQTIAGVVQTMAGFAVAVSGYTMDFIIDADPDVSDEQLEKVRDYLVGDAASVINQVIDAFKEKRDAAATDADKVVEKATKDVAAGVEISKPTLREIPAVKND